MSERKHYYPDLLPSTYKEKITQWLAEDIPGFDYGGYVVGEKENVASLVIKDSGVLAGCPFFQEVFKQLQCRVEWLVKEGEEIKGPREIARVHGKARKILQGERVALNLLARCSGIATRAAKVKTIAEEHGYNGIIAGTRKTTPGFRLVEKYGLIVGGVDTHRMDLSSMIMLKDNHIWSHGSITKAVQAAKSVGGFSLKIQVECRRDEECQEAILAGADLIMLDHYEPPHLSAVSKTLKSFARDHDKKVLFEVSGGIKEENVHLYFCEDIDIISMGCLTQGVPHVDFALKIQKYPIPASHLYT